MVHYDLSRPGRPTRHFVLPLSDAKDSVVKCTQEIINAYTLDRTKCCIASYNEDNLQDLYLVFQHIERLFPQSRIYDGFSCVFS